MSGLNRGLKLAQDYTTRTPAQACNTAGYHVAVSARNLMPKVTVSTIDTELSVIATPVIGKRGKPLKNRKTFKGGSAPDEVPLSVLIIQARANPNSRYNQSTNQRYALTGSPFKGVSRAAGRAAMMLLEHSMIASRHRSGGFLKAGWIPAIKALRSLAVLKYSNGIIDVAPASAGNVDDLGSATPASVGGLSASCTIENNIGYTGKNASNFNRALWLKGAPALQQAVDGEGEKVMQNYLNKSGKDLEREFNAVAG